MKHNKTEGERMPANTALLQVRTSAEDQEKSTEILEKLGTNLSVMVNIS